MNCDDIKMMISDYIDNELQKEKEGFLFTHLAACSDCREEFKQQNKIQHAVKINQKEISEKFEERIYNSVRKRNTTFAQKWITKPTPVYINYVLAVVIIVITFFSFLQLSSLKYDLNSSQVLYKNSINQIKSKTNQINFIMNSLPTATVTQKIENLVVVKAKI